MIGTDGGVVEALVPKKVSRVPVFNFCRLYVTYHAVTGLGIFSSTYLGLYQTRHIGLRGSPGEISCGVRREGRIRPRRGAPGGNRAPTRPCTSRTPSLTVLESKSPRVGDRAEDQNARSGFRAPCGQFAKGACAG